MPNASKTHDECRKSVCVVCMKKSDRELTVAAKEKILQFIEPDLDFNDDRVPLGICVNSRFQLGKLDGSIKKFPTLFNFQNISKKPSTRSSLICDCLICQIGKLRGKEQHPLNKLEDSSEKSIKPENQSVEKSTKCLSLIGRGLPHNCTLGTRHENLKKIAEADGKGAELVASAVIASKDSSPNGTIRLTQQAGGKAIPLRRGASVAQQLFKTPLSTQDMVHIQQNTGLSNNGMRKLGSTLNQISPLRLVEPNFQLKFAQAGQKVADHFTASSMNLSEDNQTREVVHCHSLIDLSVNVQVSRNLGDSVILKLGIDGGGSFLKVSFTHIELEKNELEPQSPIQKNMKLTSPLSAKATSVKQQMLVALSQDTPETYQNDKQIFGLIKIHEKFLLDSLVISCDLKLANILCGIQSHSSKHPCCWCEAENTNLIRCGHPRTSGQIRKQFAEFMKSGGDIRKSRDFKNVVHLPLLNFHDDMLVLEAIPPMELHLLLGVVNHLFKNLCDLWPDAKQWPTTLHLSIQLFHGGHFNGNDCLNC